MELRFYIGNEDKAAKICREMLSKGWDKKFISDYWYSLGYDIFWIRKVFDIAFNGK